ncbi:ribosome biogenesis protein NOP53-like isoform X2 [Watersipora subatra]|uniref:ribosome biogenesis protein NOP53-like isoform X2 n=1 Tax=Watersipora subatra TaxID=2589382 RepID=UPI00355B0EB4
MRSRVSKNRKKGWKKVDIADVEDAIEDQRIQERTGGLAAEKTDDQLYFIDTDIKSFPVPIGKTHGKDKKLKCFANLEADPRIPAVSRQVSGHSKQKFRRDVRPVTRKLTQALQERKRSLSNRATIRTQAKKMHQENYDLWQDNSSKYADEHFATVTKKSRVKAPATLQAKPSTIAAVETPHPGSSYNPAFDDHQQLLQKTVVKQVKEDVDEARLERKLKPNYGSDGPPSQVSLMKELSQGLGLVDEDDQSDSSLDEQGEEPVNASKTCKMKTKKQKRKRKERLKAQSLLSKEKEDRIRQDRNSNERLKTIKKQVAAREKLLAKKAALREAKRVEKAGGTKRLYKKKFVEPDEDVLLTSELKGSLALTRCNTSLLDDRFKSLQKRNIIEPRTRAKFRRKYKPKFVEKKAFKEITAKSRAGGGLLIPFHQKKHNEKE